VDPLVLPPDLVNAARYESRTGWLDRLPGLVRALAERWDLDVDVGAPFRPGGRAAWVAPARSARHGDVVLKVGWRHPESDHEAVGLRAWDGDGMVRLLADHRPAEDTTALLLELCRPGATLVTVRPESEQDAIVASLLRRLWIEPPSGHGFRTLADMCETWAAEAERRRWPPGLDRGLVSDGLALFRGLPATAERSVLLCTDLHAGNVLAAEREAWLAIDPKPYVGDPTYDALQHLLNCDERLHADPHGLVRRLADLLDLDADRLRHWLFARCVIEAPGWPELVDVARRLATTNDPR
jgi:streptomycin 6-kinase